MSTHGAKRTLRVHPVEMADANLNQLLKWSVQNSDVPRNDATAQSDPKAERDPQRGLNAEALSQLFGGPSDADRMRESMAAVQSPSVNLDNKMIAFDNFEQLVENIDNANNMENLGLWQPMVEQLDNSEAQLRKMAAWCVGTAVQNNPRAQERCLVIGAIPKLVHMAIDDTDKDARKKASRGLSSAIRNYQPSLDSALEVLPHEYHGGQKVDAGDMDAVDKIVEKVRQNI